MNKRVDMPEVLEPEPLDGYKLPTRTDERSMGSLIRRRKALSEEQLEDILVHQREHRLRFGDSAVALQLASPDDVLWALSQQFDYAYASEGECARSPELVVSNDPFGAQAEAFRELRAQLVLDAGASHSALAVASPEAGEGKSFVAANLAITFSQLGGRTLLLDADLRAPRQAALFALAARGGLSDILAGRMSIDVIHQIPGLPSLYVLPAGTLPPNPQELLQRPGFGVLMAKLLDRFDHVLVDTPAWARAADARVVAAHCGRALVVGRRSHTRLARMNTLIASLARSNVHLAGVVMNEH